MVFSKALRVWGCLAGVISDVFGSNIYLQAAIMQVPLLLAHSIRCCFIPHASVRGCRVASIRILSCISVYMYQWGSFHSHQGGRTLHSSMSGALGMANPQQCWETVTGGLPCLVEPKGPA